MRKVRAPQSRIADNISRGQPPSKCNRDIPPQRDLSVRVERRGKSSPERRRRRCHVNLIRCNTNGSSLSQWLLVRLGTVGGLSRSATVGPDRLPYTTEPGLQVRRHLIKIKSISEVYRICFLFCLFSFVYFLSFKYCLIFIRFVIFVLQKLAHIGTEFFL